MVTQYAEFLRHALPPHDYAALLKRYRDDVVSRHASGTVTEKTQCRGTTARGNKRCCNRAQIQGYCLIHAAQMASAASAQRKVKVYQGERAEPASLEAVLGRVLGDGPVSSAPYVFYAPSRAMALSLL